VRVVVKAHGGSVALPPVGAVRASVVGGTPGACAAVTFHGPGGVRPRCDGGGTRLTCR